MQKLKNIFYDKSDILVALIIVCVASLIIFYRIEAIMAFPSTLSADKGTRVNAPVVQENEETDKSNETANETSTNSAVADKDNEKDSSKSNSTKEDSSKDNKRNKVENYSIYIESGSNGSDIANILLSVNLIKDKQEFYDAMSTAGAESKLQAGTFIVPSNSTPAEVVAIITK